MDDDRPCFFLQKQGNKSSFKTDQDQGKKCKYVFFYSNPKRSKLTKRHGEISRNHNVQVV